MTHAVWPCLTEQSCPQHVWPKSSTSNTVRSIVNYKTRILLSCTTMWSIYAVIIASQHLCIPSHYQKCETMTAIVMTPKCISANSYVIVFLLLSCAAVGCIELQLYVGPIHKRSSTVAVCHNLHCRSEIVQITDCAAYGQLNPPASYHQWVCASCDRLLQLMISCV